MRILLNSILLVFSFSLISATAIENANVHQYYWLKIKAQDKFQRSIITEDGIAIEIVKDDYVIAYGSEREKQLMEKRGWLLSASNLYLEKQAGAKDFPQQDQLLE